MNTEHQFAGETPGANVREDDEGGLQFGEILATAFEYKWLIVGVTSLVLAVAAGWLYNTTPAYRANALLQIEGGKAMTALSELQPLLSGQVDQDTATSAQLQIIRSRSILGRVVDRLGLDIVAQPLFYPWFGEGKARRYVGDTPAPAFLGLAQYAWGGEAIRVDRFDMPRTALGHGYAIEAGQGGAYRLLDGEREVLAGRIGQVASGGGVTLFVSQLRARPLTRFLLVRIPRQDAIAALQGGFVVAERKGSGVVDATLAGSDAAALAPMLDAILDAYVRQNVEFRSAEAESTLKFLEQQLPVIKSQLDAAEAAYNDYRQSRGSVDLDAETQSVLASLVQVDKEIVALQQQRDELRQRFTGEHPSVRAMDAKIARVRSQRGQFNTQVAKLPDTQQTALRLKRDLEVNSKLYSELLNSAQQLRVSKAGTVGDARVIDAAVLEPLRVSPNVSRSLGLSLVLGLALSLALVWLRRSLRVVVEDPDKLEKQLGLPVYATVPHSKAEDALTRAAKRGDGGKLLAVVQPEDDAVESLRSLRTTIHFALLDASRASLLVTGSSPGVGKSFVSKNLAAVLAQSGKKVVVVDADLRRGHLHREFGFVREAGVSEYVSGQLGLDAIIKPYATQPGLDVVTTGQRPPNPSELLMHSRFETLLEELGKRYDTVIVDAPPVLAVSDAAIIGRHTGATLMVARAGKHPLRELEQAVKRLAQAGVKVKGFVFNDMDTTRQRYRYGYKGYVYQYSYKSARKA